MIIVLLTLWRKLWLGTMILLLTLWSGIDQPWLQIRQRKRYEALGTRACIPPERSRLVKGVFSRVAKVANLLMLNALMFESSWTKWIHITLVISMHVRNWHRSISDNQSKKSWDSMITVIRTCPCTSFHMGTTTPVDRIWWNVGRDQGAN